MFTSKALYPAELSYFQSIISVVLWMVEIGRTYIATEVSLLLSHPVYPREGHIEAALHVMAYLKHKYKSQLVFDTTYTKIDESILKDCECRYFYGDAKGVIQPNAPKPCGKDVDLRAKVDIYHT